MSLMLHEIATKGDIAEVIKRLERVEQENAILRRSLADYIGTGEAMRLTGLCRDALYDLRQAGKVEWKYEGRKVLYLRSSVETYNDLQLPRRRRKQAS